MRRRATSMADVESESSPPPVVDPCEKGRGPDANSVLPSQAVPIVGVPSFANCIKWSEENLLGVAAGHLVTILNPASMSGPRGFIPVVTSPVFNIGKVHPEDLQAPSILPFCLARDPRPWVRAIDWSPPGLAQNGGCLLAMCTTDCRVKVYRAPFCDFQSEWVEILDLSELAFNYCLDSNFRDAELTAVQLAMEEEAIPTPLKWGFRVKRKLSDDEEPQHRKVQKMRHPITNKLTGSMDLVVAQPISETSPTSSFQQHSVQTLDVLEQAAGFWNEAGLLSSIKEGSQVEVLEEDGGLRYWVGASVVEIVNGEALVRLDRPQYGAMHEWVAFPSQNGQENEDSIAMDSTGEQDSIMRIRSQWPRIRPLVTMGTLEKNMRNGEGGHGSLASGKLVEAWMNQRWQEGVVVGFDGSGVIINFSTGSNNAVMELDKLRLAPFWQGNRWIWKTSAAVSNHRIEKIDHSSTDIHLSRTLLSTGELDPRREKRIQALGCATSLRLITERESTSPAMSSAEKDSPLDDAQEEDELQGKDADDVQDMVVVKTVDSRYKGKDKVKQEKKLKGVTLSKATSSGNSVNTAMQIYAQRNARENCISAPDFAARSEMLSPLVLAWSSKYEEPPRADGKVQRYAILGAGMKSGRIGFWRISYPPSYRVDHAHSPVAASFLGFLFAHESWVTNLSWGTCCNFNLRKLNPRACANGDGMSGETLLLATACSDGSVKLWAGFTRDFTGLPCVEHSVPFMFLRQVVKVDCVPVTSVALIVPPQTGDTALLAVGKGSGSVAVWEIKAAGTFSQIGLEPLAHQQMVTGFSWTYDGQCLYSCGQDSLRRWGFSEDQLLPLPFPDCSVASSNTATDLSSLEAMESFFGVVLSHNSLVLAAVRGMASDLLDQMYQARSQKGMVQLFWLGSEHVGYRKGKIALSRNVSQVRRAMSMSRYEKVCWELNIVAALEHLQDPRQTLVMWDLVAALLLLKERIGVDGVVPILSKWLSSWGQGQGAVGAVDPHEWATGSFQKVIPEASCRKLQMLNVIYRRFFLCHVKAEVLSGLLSEEVGSNDDYMQAKLWMDRMRLVEHDLRERLVHYILYSFDDHRTLENDVEEEDSAGLQLLEKWVLGNVGSVSTQLVKLTTQLCNTEGDLLTNSGRVSVMEDCIFCDSPVLFESPEIARCSGSDIKVGASKHHLQRCSISMQVCPPVCLWHCGCCARTALKQPSSFFFSLPSKAELAEMNSTLLDCGHACPLCPFCGILMHRLLPKFFLIPSLV